MKKNATIVVLAGINGAGKSSIGGHFAQTERDFFYNPDSIAARIQSLHPHISPPLANAHAWEIGRALLEQAITTRRDYRFETTLGGETITDMLIGAAESGLGLHVWFCGLESPELHIRRVRSRVAHGGHDIPEDKIHERWISSRRNLIRLLPHIHHLRVYDNTFESDPAAGKKPRPVLWLEMKNQRITAPAELSGAPVWVQPIIAAGYRLHRLDRNPGTKSPRQPGRR
jgi:predicted ABC-type ATPase